MLGHFILRSKRCTLGLALLAGSLLAFAPMAPNAEAAISACRSDPVVVLSNLAVIDLSANIGDSSSDVRSITYVIHAPVGTVALATVNTDGLVGLKEHIQFYADNTVNNYDFYTTVTTGKAGAPVTAESTEISVLELVLGLGSTPGISNHALHTHFTSLL